MRADTLYVATTGGMGPLTLACLDALLQDLAKPSPTGVLVAATDADKPGERYAGRLAERWRTAAGVRSERLRAAGRAERLERHPARRGGCV